MRNLCLALALLPTTACATTGIPAERDAHALGARVELDFAHAADSTARAVFPAARDPRLPSADRIARRLAFLVGDTGAAAADVDVCVAPSGRVASAALARPSGIATFDRAVMADVGAWQFAAMPGPDSVKSCERLTISYHLHD